MHDINFLKNNTMMHVQTGLCVGGGKPPFIINRGLLEFNNSNCEILSHRSLDNYLNEIITAIVIPSYIKEIGNCSFSNNHALTLVKYMSKAPIPKRAFYNCGSLKDVYIYGNVKEISPLAFTETIAWCGEYNETKNHDIIIHAKKDSYAHEYAKKYGFKFEELNNEYCLKKFKNSFFDSWQGTKLKRRREQNLRIMREMKNRKINRNKYLERLKRRSD